MLYGILKSSTNTGLDSEILVPFITPISVESNSPTFGGDSYTLRRISVSQPNQRWEIEAGLAQTVGASGIMSNVFKNGSSGILYIRPPQPIRPGYVYPGSAAVNGALIKGSTNLNITGLGYPVAPVDEFIKFDNHNKVYMITAPGSGGVGVEIYPPLVASVPNATPIRIGGTVTMRANYDFSNKFTVTYDNGTVTNPGSKRLVENWRAT